MEATIHSLIVLLTTAAGFAENKTNYCHIKSCLPFTHTMCRFPEPGPGPRCKNTFHRGLNQLEKDKLLLVHNNLRARVYAGYERRGSNGPQPLATKFFTLEWDDELADNAQRWSEQCIGGVDRCRNVERFLVNQLFKLVSLPGIEPEFVRVENIILEWYGEVKHFDRNNILHYRPSAPESLNTTIHYTQIVWAETTKLGCGASRYKNRETNYRFLLVCNYAPNGNIVGRPIYPIRIE